MNMQNNNRSDETINDDPTWCVISEYALDSVLVGEDINNDLMLGHLYKTLRDLGIQPGHLNKLEETIAGITAGTRRVSSGGDPPLPVLIRLLCQRTSVDSLSHLEKYRNGGWGYYLIERDAELSDASYRECLRVVEVYLYKEGE